MAAMREASALPALDLASRETRFAKLSPGPGRSAGEVALHQRTRLFAAVTEIVSEHGYDAVTVRELARLAGVSTRTFYEHFESKEECLLRAVDLIAQHVATQVAMGQREERDWRERLRLAFLSFAHEIEHQPRMARLVLLEALAAGPPALQRVRAAEQVFEGKIEDSFSCAPDGVVVPAPIIEGIVAGVASVARARLLVGREGDLPGLADELTEWALCYRSEYAAVLEQLETRPALDRYASSRADVGSIQADTSEQAPGDERALILSAVARLAAVEGCQRLTIPRIRAVAGVSRKSFDANFRDVRDCCIGALELHAANAVSHASTAFAKGRTWAEGIHSGIAALCDYIASDPVLIRLGFVEIFALGSEGLRARERLTAQVTELFVKTAPQSNRPSMLVAEASVGAVWGVIHHRVALGQAQQLPYVAPFLSFIALTPAIGARAAVDAIGQGVADSAQASTIDRPIGRGAA